MYQQKNKTMQLEKTQNGLTISAIVSGYRVKEQYQGYTVKEAKKLFKEKHMPKKRILKKGSVIVMLGRRWFDKVNGNTYHSAKLYVNGDFIGYIPCQYGYGDQYLQSCRELLLQKFKVPNFDTEKDPTWKLRDIYDTNKIKFIAEVSDVAKKKDL